MRYAEADMALGRGGHRGGGVVGDGTGRARRPVEPAADGDPVGAAAASAHAGRRTVTHIDPGSAAASSPTPAGEPTAAAPVPEPSPAVAWTELRYAAHKLFLSASTTIQTEWVPAAELATLLRRPERGRAIAVPADGAVAVSLASELPFGRDERVTLWLDPANGAALGARRPCSAAARTTSSCASPKGASIPGAALPETSANGRRGPEGWTDRSRYLVEPAVGPPQGTPVTDPYALIYLVTAARLDRKDSSLKLVLLSDDRYVEMRSSPATSPTSRAGLPGILAGRSSPPAPATSWSGPCADRQAVGATEATKTWTSASSACVARSRSASRSVPPFRSPCRGAPSTSGT